MVAGNIGAVKAAIQKKVQAAMNQSMNLANEDMITGLHLYYASAEPKMYHRTDKLMNTNRIQGVFGGGDQYSFEAYLDQNGGYSTADCPTMLQVLNLTNYRKPWTTKGGRIAHKAVGSFGYWERIEDAIHASVVSVFSSYFG